jgi:hypothetical protein
MLGDFIGRRRSGPHYEQFMRRTGAFKGADIFMVPKAIPNTSHINRLAFAILAGMPAFDDPSAWPPPGSRSRRLRRKTSASVDEGGSMMAFSTSHTRDTQAPQDYWAACACRH